MVMLIQEHSEIPGSSVVSDLSELMWLCLGQANSPQKDTDILGLTYGVSQCPERGFSTHMSEDKH